MAGYFERLMGDKKKGEAKEETALREVQEGTGAKGKNTRVPNT